MERYNCKKLFIIVSIKFTFLYMQIVAWSLTNQTEQIKFENSEFKGRYKSIVTCKAYKRLEKNPKLEAKCYHIFIICSWNLAKSSIGTYGLLWINNKSRNCRHEHELPVNSNQFTFWTNYVLNKCRICVIYERLHKIVRSKYPFVLKKNK